MTFTELALYMCYLLLLLLSACDQWELIKW